MEGIDFGGEVRRIISKLETSNPDLSATSRVQRAWRKVADEGALKHTNAVFVVPDTNASEVIIYVDAQIWATDLSLQAELYRLRLNLEIQRLLEREGRVRRTRDADALFDYQQTEHIKKLMFKPSKEKYAHRYLTVEEDTQGFGGASDIEPVDLDAGEEERLYEEVSSIQDPALRQVVYNAARSNLELLKGKQQMQ